MAATTINRTGITVTNDTGTPSAPNGDGTLWNDAYVDLFLDRIDALFSGNFTVGGLVTAEGFGTHTLSASGTGVQTLRVANTAAGTGNVSQFELTNNASVVTQLQLASSTFSSANGLNASGCRLQVTGSGGLNVVSTHASGDVGIYTNTTRRFLVDSIGIPTFERAAASLIYLKETDAGADLKLWRFVSVDGQLQFDAANDTVTDANIVWSVTRTGYVPGTFRTHCDFTPSSTNVFDLGSSAARFAEIWGTAIFSGDLNFENGYSWTESYKAGVKTPGMAMTNTRGTVVLFVDGRGNVYANRFKNLSDLQRAA